MSFTYKWVVPDDIDHEGFDFSWRPDPLDPPYIHQFGTQWQKTGGPALIVSDATEIKYQSSQRVKKLPCKDNWITSVDIIDWDYSWHPDENEPPYIHQFSTQWSKNGGPKYVVPGARTKKYHDTPVAVAAPSLKNWSSRYKVRNWDYSWHPDPLDPDYIYVWGSGYYSVESDAVIQYQTPGATKYKYMKDTVVKVDLDVVYVSNGEPGEHARFLTLQALTDGRAKWVHGVQGREQALKQAAEIATTDWFYCFPGKLLADPDFDFDWHPKISYGEKHYIFYAQNSVNGLVYGHQAAVCYNRRLVLDARDWGLDFTMSSPHDIVPVISGVAQYDCDPLVTWRTAFREAVKLQMAADAGDMESASRLNTWLTVGHGTAGTISKHGAAEGVKFYHDVGGDSERLLASWDWSWLQQRYIALDKPSHL